ncbi:hypothetical protein [Blastopirellula marina]|uniref:hypothetical protein n=1 Tax=Blastopirellula marina TaxID=124 RepID=UPI0002E89D6E|nr:hypothetical protein [Blastopirellula marina]
MKTPRNFWVAIACLSALSIGGCIESQATQVNQKPFETQELDACLAVVVDMSGSFHDQWDDRAYTLFLQLIDRFFTEGMGSESRVVLGQLSDNQNAILFEGTPAEMRRRFRSPEELNEFLKANSDPKSSPVFEATGKTVEFMSSMPGVTERTRLLTVVLSDMADSEQDPETRSQKGFQMLDSLKRYRAQGGGLALYFVSQEETARWRRILSDAGFEPGQYVIEHEMVANAQLPRFD